MKSLLYTSMVIAAAVTSLSCSNLSYHIPVFEQAPPVLEIQTMTNKYVSDPNGAAALYEGNAFLFPSVAVDQVSNLRTLQGEEFMSGELFAACGPARFFPMYLHDLDEIGPGFVVDITGQVQGYTGRYYSIINCTYWVIEGGTLPPPSGY